MQHEDTILIERLRKGDILAFERLFKAHYEKLCLFAARFTDDVHTAEEIVSDAYAVIWEKKETLLISISFRSYIYKMVQNRCMNHIKHRKIEKEYIDYIVTRHLPEDDPDHVQKEREIERRVTQAVESLPDRCRQIFKMSRYDNLKYWEIALRLNLSPKTVERQMVIALEKLRRQLRDVLVSA
jgi:RNA polymerase sigma-70 factor (family 1)